MKSRYELDSELVYKYRRGHAEISLSSRSWDQFRSGMEELPKQTYRATYNEWGFRTNSSSPPFDVALIGDSFVETGATDSETLSELLKTTSGLTTANFGMSGYGPQQELKIFERYVLPLKPKFAVLCYYNGNDLWELAQYERWLAGEQYARFILDRPLFQRFLLAFTPELRVALGISTRLRGLGRYLGIETKPSSDKQANVAKQTLSSTEDSYLAQFPEVASVRLGERRVRMVFNFWRDQRSVDEMLQAQEYLKYQNIVRQFRRSAIEAGIVPIVLYIPAKDEVYAGLSVPAESGKQVQQELPKHLAVQDRSRLALTKLLAEIQITLLDPTPAFRQAAETGALLYEQYDSHWNAAGAQLAAVVLGNQLKNESQKFPPD